MKIYPNSKPLNYILFKLTFSTNMMCALSLHCKKLKPHTFSPLLLENGLDLCITL